MSAAPEPIICKGMKMRAIAGISLGVFLVAAGCSGEDAAGPPIDQTRPSLVCKKDADCASSHFCGTTWKCEPGSPAANVWGCVGVGLRSCDDGDPCTIDQCNATPEVNACVHVPRDDDGDGYGTDKCKSVVGNDCDDGDRARFPGAPPGCSSSNWDCEPGEEKGAEFDADGDGCPGAAECWTDMGFTPLDPRCVFPGDECDNSAGHFRRTAVYYIDRDEDGWASAIMVLCEGDDPPPGQGWVKKEGYPEGYSLVDPDVGPVRATAKKRTDVEWTACTFPSAREDIPWTVGDPDWQVLDCDDDDDRVHPDSRTACNNDLAGEYRYWDCCQRTVDKYPDLYRACLQRTSDSSCVLNYSGSDTSFEECPAGEIQQKNGQECGTNKPTGMFVCPGGEGSLRCDLGFAEEIENAIDQGLLDQTTLAPTTPSGSGKALALNPSSAQLTAVYVCNH
jgi:hypothetical protein